MLKKRTINISLMVLFLMVVSVFIPAKITQAETSNNHKVFTQKIVDRRIAEIRNYYYKHPKKLTVKKTIYDRPYIKEKINFNYYLKGNDLMFAYGTSTDKEYRLYFYKNQLIRMLVDEKGKGRVTYDQLYKHSFVNYPEVIDYIDFENFFKIKYASLYKKTSVKKLDDYVFITNISATDLTYHTGKTSDADGYIWTLGTKAYIAKLSRKVKVLDGSLSPGQIEKRTLNWLRSNLTSGGCREARVKVKNGKVVEIEIPYQP